ncbi:MAG: N-acetyltransferase [Gracilimonas sp.]
MNKGLSLTIREEKPADHEAVESLIQRTFTLAEHSGGDEHLLVKRLRKSTAFISELSLVAELGNDLVGHILLTKVIIKSDESEFESLALAPVSVLPEFQNKGIGGKLIQAAHDQAREMGFTSLILLGHENYYPRFGYKPAHVFDISFPFDAPPENCMVIELSPNSLKYISGEVVYPKEFFE